MTPFEVLVVLLVVGAGAALLRQWRARCRRCHHGYFEHGDPSVLSCDRFDG